MIWEGPGKDNKHQIYSCTKTFTSTVLGVLATRQKLDIDDLAVDYFPELDDGDSGQAIYNRVRFRDLATMTAAPAGFTGTCPSVSPDGTHIAFKRRLPGSDLPRLMVRDLRSGEEWVLGEAGFVDDQVEWLDDDTVIYAMPRDDARIQPATDIWALDIAPDARPDLLVPFAAAPAIYRDSRIDRP